MEYVSPEAIQTRRQYIVFNVLKKQNNSNKKPVNLEFYTQWNYLSKTKAKQKHFEMYKNWSKSSPSDQHYNKCWSEFFRQRENVTSWKSGSKQRTLEMVTRNSNERTLEQIIMYGFMTYIEAKPNVCGLWH